MAKTVQFGIDLGTTNSSIAQMTPRGVDIIQVQDKNYISSAVAVDSRGNFKVGAAALSQGNPATKFKRLMGSTEVVGLSDREMSPQELSSLILKELKKAAKLRTNEDIEDVVITVPAMFNQPQCAATQEAAQMAGLNAVALLQEPIAAATAYLSDNPVPGYYLVYDLGGGTFDVSLIRLHDGEMLVVDHGGDNYLGGVDFDEAVMTWTLDQIDRKGGDTKVFESAGSRHKLRSSVEDARKELSIQETANIYLDEDDMPMQLIELSRSRLEDLVETLVDKSLRITRERLEKADIQAEQVNSILLVGGPTQMPYIRHRLEEEIGIKVNLDQDPMTVVAKGAAVHAAGLLRDQRKSKPKKSDDTIQLEIHYDPVSPETEQVMAGKVVAPEGFKGEIQLMSNTKSDWETGWITLKNGAFTATISLGNDSMREFGIRLRDLQGNSKTCEPNAFTVRSGVRSASPVVPYSYGVVLEGGEGVAQIVASGSPLPASGSCKFRLAKTLIAGSPDEVVIYFVEGTNKFASDNLPVGRLAILGTSVHRTLPENTEVEIRIRVDEARLVTTRVYIPLLDADFDLSLKAATDPPSEAILLQKLIRAKADLAEVEDEVVTEDQDQIIQIERELDHLETLVERLSSREQGAAIKVHKHLTDAFERIRPLREKYLPESKYKSLVEYVDEADELCKRFEDKMGRARLTDIRDDAAKAHRLEDLKLIDELFDRVSEIFWLHYGKTRECWEYQISITKQRAAFASDPLTYHELLRRAEAALAEEDYQGVSLNTRRASELIPEIAKGKAEFHDAALRT